MARKRLGEILIQAGVLDEARLRTALREQQRWGGPLGRTLIEMRLVREDDLVRALSMQLNIPVATLRGRDIPHDTLDLLPVEFCEEHSLIPFARDGKFLDVALCDPTNLSILDEVRIRTRLNVRPYIIGPRALEQAIALHYKGLDIDAPYRAAAARQASPPVEGKDGIRYVELHTEAEPARSPNGPQEVAAPRQPAPQPQSGPTGQGQQPVDRATFEQLQKRVTQLESLLARDEAVIRKLLGLLVDQQVVTRDQILECLQL